MESGPRGQPMVYHPEHFGDPHSTFRTPGCEVPGRGPEHHPPRKIFAMLRSSESSVANPFKGKAQAHRLKDTACRHLFVTLALSPFILGIAFRSICLFVCTEL